MAQTKATLVEIWRRRRSEGLIPAPGDTEIKRETAAWSIGSEQPGVVLQRALVIQYEAIILNHNQEAPSVSCSESTCKFKMQWL